MASWPGGLTAVENFCRRERVRSWQISRRIKTPSTQHNNKG
jgi:hypothetical protein